MEPAYQVQKSSGTCNACKKEFTDGQAYFSAVKQLAGENSLLREDYCTKCWSRMENEKLFSFWKSYFQNDGKQEKVKTDVVLEFFENLQGKELPEQKNLRFVLALFLTRRKTFELKGTRRKGEVDYLVFEKKSGDTILVEDPRLTEAQIRQATDSIKKIF
jgi:hypothetical protein